MNFDDKNKMQIKPLGFIQTPGLQPHYQAILAALFFKKQHPTSLTYSLHLPLFYLVALITIRHNICFLACLFL